VPTVPPPAGVVAEAPGIPAEAFQGSQATTPAWTTRPTPVKKSLSLWMLLVAFLLLLAAGAGAAWQLGYTDDLMKLAAPYLGGSAELAAEASRDVQPVVAPTPEPAEVQPAEEAVAADAAEPTEPVAEPAVEAEATSAAATDPGVVKFQVVSRPSGAYVSVNGKGVGRPPHELEYEVGTKISFFSKARGYLARRHQITVGAEQATVSLWLAPLPYVVQVVTSPAGARASAVGGGETNTPGSLQFKSMSASRTIVVSKDGYKTASQSVSRADFTEETRRMAATINVTLQKDAAAEAAPPSTDAKSEPVTEPPLSEVKAEATPPAEPAEEPNAAEDAPAEPSVPSETAAADAP